jgi:hypothetical protein
MASSSLLQLNLFKGKFSSEIGEAMGTSDFNDVTSALQFARSGGAISALFGAVDPAHVEENLILAYLPSASKESMNRVTGRKNDV